MVGAGSGGIAVFFSLLNIYYEYICMHTKEHLDTKNPSGFACDTEFAMMMRSLRAEHHLSFAFKHEKG